MKETIDNILRRLLGRRQPDPAMLGTRQIRQRLDAMSFSSIAAYNAWLIEHGRSPCITSLEDYQEERRKAAGLIFPPRSLDTIGHRVLA